MNDFEAVYLELAQRALTRRTPRPSPVREDLRLFERSLLDRHESRQARRVFGVLPVAVAVHMLLATAAVMSSVAGVEDLPEAKIGPTSIWVCSPDPPSPTVHRCALRGPRMHQPAPARVLLQAPAGPGLDGAGGKPCLEGRASRRRAQEGKPL